MPLVEIEDRGAVRHVVMTRSEKRNALSGELVRELGEAFREAAADDSVRCVVVRGEGAMFSSGMDLADLGRLAENPETVRTYRREILVFWNLLEEMTKPTIAQIHGACLGGAMELALACDMRTMAEDAVAGLLEARIGLIPDLGGCSRLPATVGVGRAKELLMTGKVIDGLEADRDGQRAGAPVVQVAAVAGRVLLGQEAPGEGVLVGIVDRPGPALEGHLADSHRHARLAREVAYPVGAIAAARKHVDRAALEREPDLDLPWLAGDAPGGRQVEVALLAERRVDRHQGWCPGSTCLARANGNGRPP